MQLKLTFKTTGESWTLQPDREYIIGRDQNCDIALPSVVTISSRHLKVVFDKLTSQWCIKDLGSSNGTFIRSQRVTDAVIQGVTDIMLSHEVNLVAVPETGSIPTVMSPMVAGSSAGANATVMSSNAAGTGFPAYSNTPPQEATPKKHRDKPAKRQIALPIISVTLMTALLAAIAMPSFLNQATKARQSEGKQFTGHMARSQQAYYLQNSKFAANLDELQLPYTPSGLHSYVYWTHPISPNAVQQIAMPRQQDLRMYTSVVVVNSSSSTSAETCVGLEAGQAPVNFLLDAGAVSSGAAVCPPGFRSINNR